MGRDVRTAQRRARLSCNVTAMCAWIPILIAFVSVDPAFACDVRAELRQASLDRYDALLSCGAGEEGNAPISE